MTGEDAGIQIEAAACRIAGDQRHGAILIKVSDRVGVRRRRQSGRQSEGVEAGRNTKRHDKALVPIWSGGESTSTLLAKQELYQFAACRTTDNSRRKRRFADRNARRLMEYGSGPSC